MREKSTAFNDKDLEDKLETLVRASQTDTLHFEQTTKQMLREKDNCSSLLDDIDKIHGTLSALQARLLTFEHKVLMLPAKKRNGK